MTGLFDAMAGSISRKMIAFSTIQEAAMRIAEQFKPEKIILFASYAYGKPNEHSDVDLMVLTRGRNVEDLAIEMRRAMRCDFAVDLLVRTPALFDKRIAMGDFFLTEIRDKGKVLYEAADEGMGRQGRGGFRNGKSRTAGKKVA
jgi:predicted nucleotidyltransferase